MRALPNVMHVLKIRCILLNVKEGVVKNGRYLPKDPLENGKSLTGGGRQILLQNSLSNFQQCIEYGRYLVGRCMWVVS
jgi:hypothetical protein